MPSPYQGFAWNNFSYSSKTSPTSGFTYANVPTAPLGTLPDEKHYNYAVYRNPSLAASITKSGGATFTLNSTYLTAAYRDNLQVNITATYETENPKTFTYTLSAVAPTLFNFYNYLAGVTRLEFTATGGTEHGYTPFPGSTTILGAYNFTMDVMTFDGPVVPPPAVIPEPSTLLAAALLLIPFGASTLRILRQKRSA